MFCQSYKWIWVKILHNCRNGCCARGLVTTITTAKLALEGVWDSSPPHTTVESVVEVAHPFLQHLHIPFLICSCDYMAQLGCYLEPEIKPCEMLTLAKRKIHSILMSLIFSLHMHKLQRAKKFNTATLSLVHQMKKKKLKKNKSKHFWKVRNEGKELVILTY